jgi:hypothetical protein
VLALKNNTDVLKSNCTKRAQRIVSQRLDSVDGGADDPDSQVIDAMASEVFDGLVLDVVEPG